MVEGYAVDTTSAEAVAAATETKVGELDTLKSSLKDPLESARGALPDGFAAIARLETLQTDHTTDVDTIKTYATSCVTGLRSCLAIYENSSAEMVAEQKATEAKVVFTHDGLLDYAAKPVNDKLDEWEKPLNKGMPKVSEGTSTKTTYEQTVTNGGENTTVAKSHTVKSDGGNTSTSQHSVSNTHHGVTDTTTYYGNTSNGNRSTGQSYVVSSNGVEQSRSETGAVPR